MACTLEGEYLLGGMPFVDQIDLLGVEGVAPEEPRELVAMSCLSTDGGGSCNAGAAGLPVGKDLLSQLREYCPETLQDGGGPVLQDVPLLTLHLQFQIRR